MKLNHGLCRLFVDYPSRDLIANDGSEKRLLEQGIMLSIARSGRNQAWTVSPYAALTGAARDELAKLPRFQAALLGLFMMPLALLLRWGGAHRVAGIQNFGLSTHLYSDGLTRRSPADLRRLAIAAAPNDTPMLRSLNAAHHADWLDKLAADGWLLLVSRQIYLVDDQRQALRRRDNRRDLKLLDDGRYRFRRLDGESADADFQTALAAYNALYLGKYSAGNMQFTTLFLKETVSRGLMDLYLMERVSGGVAAGCAGMIVENGILTTPVLGYDLRLPQSEALYRRLSVFIARYCAERGLRQHLSSGAPLFKKTRGAVPALEYTAVYVRHLPLRRRAVWYLLGRLSNGLYRNILEKYGL